jgi:hypothetical protein
MTYKEQIHAVLGFMYNETKCFATSSTYHIPYEKIKNAYSMWIGDVKVQEDIAEEWCDSKYMDKIQALDFDDTKQEVVVMIWESNDKKKKYTIDNYEEFCKEALQAPPIEEFMDGSIDEAEWYKHNMIHITVGNHDIELDYNADSVNEIEYALREMYEVERDIRGATTGNTIGSEYPNATWKDILRFAVLDGFYEDSHSLEAEIDKCINRFTTRRLEEVMKKINEQTSMNDELEVNFFKLETKDLWKIFDKEERRKAFKEIICSKVELSEMINENGEANDIVVIMDYSIKPSGDLVGWHYGVDFDKDSEDNQDYIQTYIEEMTK